MNDTELIAAVRESVADVHTTTPVEQIVSRGRAVRARRRIPGVAAALAAAAGAAVAAVALWPASAPASPPASNPASPPASHRPGTQLTAWTVARLPGGDIAVTIHQLYYPAGLQQKIRAAGVPAHVTFGTPDRSPAGCRAYLASRAVMREVFPQDRQAPLDAIVIRPSALPTGAGVYIDDYSNPYGYIGLQITLVHTSRQCTG